MRSTSYRFRSHSRIEQGNQLLLSGQQWEYGLIDPDHCFYSWSCTLRIGNIPHVLTFVLWYRDASLVKHCMLSLLKTREYREHRWRCFKSLFFTCSLGRRIYPHASFYPHFLLIVDHNNFFTKRLSCYIFPTLNPQLRILISSKPLDAGNRVP